MHRYEIMVFWSSEDKAFIADVPEISGCKAHGNSQIEALNNAREAMELRPNTAQEFRDMVPKPKAGQQMYT